MRPWVIPAAVGLVVAAAATGIMIAGVSSGPSERERCLDAGHAWYPVDERPTTNLGISLNGGVVLTGGSEIVWDCIDLDDLADLR